MRKMFMAVGVAGFMTTAFAEAIFVGTGESRVVNVEEGQTVVQQDAVVVSSESRGLSKTGGGTWMLSGSKAVQTDPLAVTVGEGAVSLSLDESAAPTVAAPTEILNKALIWFDASKAGTVHENGTDGVDYWMDARENTAAAAGGTFSYTRAVSSRWLVDQVPTKDAYEGHDVVNFGCKRSGRYMMFIKPDGTTNELTGIQSFFAVQAITNTWGYLLGGTKAGNTEYSFYTKMVPGSSSGCSLANLRADPVWNTSESLGVINGARTYVDGRWIDGFAKAECLLGLHLMNVDLRGTAYGQVNCFFNDRDYQKDSTTGKARTVGGNRVGGDMLAEVLVFTNKLTETERLQVQTHLLRKWGVTSRPTDYTLALARGTTASLAATKTGDVSVVGDGTIVRTATDAAYVQPMTDDRVILSSTNATPKGGYNGFAYAAYSTAARDRAFRGDMRLEAGQTIVNTPVPLRLRAGESVEAKLVTQGNRVTVGTADAADAVVKTGAGLVAANALPDDVKKLQVSAGTFAFVAPSVATTVDEAAAVIEATIPNHDFESVTSWDENSYCAIGVGKTVDGWTGAGTWAWDSYAGYSKRKSQTNGGTYGNNGFDLPAPYEGVGQLNVQYKMSAHTTASVPRDGVYELSFWMAGSNWEKNKELAFDLQLGPDDDHLVTLGRVVRSADKTYRQYVLRTGFLKAGEYRLWIKNVNSLSSAVVFDDFHLTLVDAVSLPHGDIEMNGTMPTATALSATEEVEGWNLEQAEGYVSGTPNVAVANPNCGVKYFDVQKNRYGCRSLFFCGIGGKATLTNVTLKAGAYRLAAALGRRQEFLNNKTVYGANPVLKATVVAGETSFALGTVTQSAHDRTSVTWPTALVLDEDTTVDLVLEQTTDGGLVADDFDLLPGTEVDLLANGGMNGSAGWTIHKKDASGYNSAEFVSYGGDWDKYASPSYFEGTGYAKICGTGEISQEVRFPVPGLYRLTFHAHTRYHGGNLSWANNPVRAYLTDGGAETNVLGVTLTDFNNDVAANYTRHVYDFRVTDVSRAYRLFFAGTRSGDKNQCLDGASLKLVDEASYAAAPDVPATLALAVAEGAKVRLDYAGSMTVGKLTLGGQRIVGTAVDEDGNRTVTVSAADYPDYFYGPGSIRVSSPEKGLLLIFR